MLFTLTQPRGPLQGALTIFCPESNGDALGLERAAAPTGITSSQPREWARLGNQEKPCVLVQAHRPGWSTLPFQLPSTIDIDDADVEKMLQPQDPIAALEETMEAEGISTKRSPKAAGIARPWQARGIAAGAGSAASRQAAGQLAIIGMMAP